MRLERVLRPKSIAAIGGLQAGRVVEQCKLMGYEGDIWPVHPTKTPPIIALSRNITHTSSLLTSKSLKKKLKVNHKLKKTTQPP